MQLVVGAFKFQSFQQACLWTKEIPEPGANFHSVCLFASNIAPISLSDSVDASVADNTKSNVQAYGLALIAREGVCQVSSKRKRSKFSLRETGC
jgi:hypothetical protein